MKKGALWDQPGVTWDDGYFYDEPEPVKGNMPKARIAKKTSTLNAAQVAHKIQLSLTAVGDNSTTFTGASALLATGATVVTELTDADMQVAALEMQLALARETRVAKRAAALDFHVEFVRYVDNIAKG